MGKQLNKVEKMPGVKHKQTTTTSHSFLRCCATERDKYTGSLANNLFITVANANNRNQYISQVMEIR